jgi:cholesterol oxidase
MSAQHFDVVVVGSGFGGAVCAYRLAEAGQRVCVLERGKAYPPNSFPRTQHGMSRNFWDPSEGRFGMFNVWSFKGIEALVSAGLGGGSLIYANVLLRKPREWFVQQQAHAKGVERWPIGYDDLAPHYDRVEVALGAQPYPFHVAPYDATLKTRALEKAANALGLCWELPNLAVTFAATAGGHPVPGEPIEEPPGQQNLHGRTRYTCRLCGECDIGCNYGSKNTLDYNYLTRAKHAGADLRTLAEVQTFAPRPGGGFTVGYVQHEPAEEPGRPHGRRAVEVTADRLVLSAGALGSTYLLLKNRRRFPALSEKLGAGFCGNGDLLTFAVKCFEEREGERVPYDLGPTYGPVITSTVRVADAVEENGRCPPPGPAGPGRGFYVQDAGYPAFVTWLIETVNVGTIRRLLRFAVRWGRLRLGRDPSADFSAEIAEFLGECALSRSSLPLLGMGRDVPDGTFTLGKDGYLECDWTFETSRTYFKRVRDTMEAITRAFGGRFVPNPTYRLSRVITVHPLGGCPMGATVEEGVVDPFCEVFNYPGLYVADGSVMPGPVGPNPALTIAALADRTADRILGLPPRPAGRPTASP